MCDIQLKLSRLIFKMCVKLKIGYKTSFELINYSKIMRYMLQAVTRIFNWSFIIYKIHMFTPKLNLSITLD